MSKNRKFFSWLASAGLSGAMSREKQRWREKMSGRPTKLTEELLAKAEAYVTSYESCGDPVPTVVGLALEIGVHRSTCYAWVKENERFSDVFTRVEATQERVLVRGGLEGKYNPAITKMMLTKHGYSDKVEQSHTSPDGSMSPTRIELVAPDDKNSAD